MRRPRPHPDPTAAENQELAPLFAAPAADPSDPVEAEIAAVETRATTTAPRSPCRR